MRHSWPPPPRTRRTTSGVCARWPLCVVCGKPWNCVRSSPDRGGLGREVVRHRFRIAGRTIDTTHTVRLEPAGVGCRLTLELDADSRFTRTLRPVARLMARSQLRFQAQAIARAASR